MGGVCCKDGVDKSGDHQQVPGAQQGTPQAPTSTNARAAVTGPAALIAAQEPEHHAEAAGPGPGAEEVKLPSSASASPPAPARSTADPAQVVLSHADEDQTVLSPSEAAPAAGSAVVTSPAPPPKPLDPSAPGGQSPHAERGSAVSAELAPAPASAPAPVAPATAPVPAAPASPGDSSRLATDGVPAAAAPHGTDVSARAIRSSGNNGIGAADRLLPADILRCASEPDVSGVAQEGLPSAAARSAQEALLEDQSTGAAPAASDKAVKVKVETTRRPAHGQGGGGDGSSSVSYSHSAASSQQPGSSAHHAISPHGGSSAQGALSAVGSSAAREASMAGEGAAASSAAGTEAGVGAMAGSSAAAPDASNASSTPAPTRDANTGFMFGAPRVKEHQRERRREPKRAKSQSSSSAASGAQAAGDATPGSKRSAGEGSSGVAHGAGSSGAAGSSGMAVPMMGSSGVAQSMSSSDVLGSSVPGRNVFGPGSSAAAGDGSIWVPDFKKLGRRIRMKGSTEGSSRGTGGTGRSSATIVGGGSSSSGTGTIAGGVGNLIEGGLPPAVPEEAEAEMEGEGEAGGEESDRSSNSPRSSSEHLSIMSPPEGSDVENVLQLICNIFQIPVALVAAYRSSNIFIRSTAIKLTDDDQWRYSLAQWSMLNVHDLKDVLMVPDATLDERFRDYYCVKNSPRVRFFMASPLRSSVGELLGTLCMADFNEKMLEPANLLVVNNLQTLVIRQLERDMALAQERIENEAATEKLQQEMMKALDHFEKCIMFVDTSKPGWEVLYTNMAWEHVTGVPREHVMGLAAPSGNLGNNSRVPRVHVMGRPLQDFFMALGGASLDWSSTAAELASRSEFTVNRVAVRQKPDKLVSLHLRQATSEASGELEGLLPKGLPAWVKARGTEAHNYFVFVEEVNLQAAGNSTVYEALAKHVEKVPGLELSHLLGKGGFGSVYYGTWNGMPVAVKMIDNRLTKTNTEGVSLEALMGQELAHPNIVKTIKYVMRHMLNASSMSGSNSRGTGSHARGGAGPGGPYHSRGEFTSNNAGAHSTVYPPLGLGSRHGSRHGSRGLMLPAGGDGAGNGGPRGSGAPSGTVVRGSAPTPGMMPYLTSAQPGLSGMTSAQMAAAADLTSASAMQHIVNTIASDATTVIGGGSHYSGATFTGGNEFGGGSSGVPPRVGNLVGSSAVTPSAQAADGVSVADDGAGGGGTAGTSVATSGMTAVGPASVVASSASTAAGPPSVASGSAAGGGAGVPANVGSPLQLSRNASHAALHVHGPRGGSGSVPHAPTVPYINSAGVGDGARSPRVGPVVPGSPRGRLHAPVINSAGALHHRNLTPAGAGPGAVPGSPPLRDPSAAAAIADEASARPVVAAYPPPPVAASGLTAEQQAAAMTSRFSLAFSTITSNGDVLVPGKGSPSSSSGHTQAMQHGSAGSGEDMGEVWIIMEFCDRGSLQDALDRGALKLRKPGGEPGETHLPMMIATACEVASALQYLHDKGIVHGDLTAWNVMLCTAQTDRSGRNFVAKVADFGLSRTLDVKSKIKTRTYGTISHMPPECLISGIISKATDVFAFGVLLWQMYTGLRPWAGMNHGQIIYNVGMKNVQLLFPPGTPPAIADLSSSCTRTDPATRPSFTEIMDKLGSIRVSLGL